MADQTRQLDLFLADDQEKEMVLNNYFQFLSKLLEKHGPQLNRTDKTTIQTVARLNTLSALEQLDPRRKTLLIRTLYEAGLLYRYKNITLKNPGIIPLHNANLSHIDLSVSDDDLGYQAFFMNAFLGRMWLNGAAFRGLHIDGCSFIETNLNHGDLSGTQVVDSTNSGVEPSQQGISFVQASLKHTRFIGAWYNSDRVLFLSAKMDDVNMQHMQCHACIFANAVMIRANLSYAIFGPLDDRIYKQNPSVSLCLLSHSFE